MNAPVAGAWLAASAPWVSGPGHFLHREQPAAVNQLLLDWLH